MPSYKHLINQAHVDGIERVNVVCIIRNERNEFLICQRSATKQFYPNVWHVPGGAVEEGEDPEQTIQREMQEELDVQVLDSALVPIDFEYLHGDKRARNLTFDVLITGTIHLNEENQAWEFMSPEKAMRFLSPTFETFNKMVTDYVTQTTTSAIFPASN
jgi:mutator protein MutT